VHSVHIVAHGQTLYSIARTYGVSVEEIAAANGLSRGEPLKTGERLVIPGVLRPLPVPEEGASVEPEPPAPVAGGPTAPSSGELDWPLRGVLYAHFGKKGNEPHDGIDLAAPTGTPVKTAGAGRVIYAGEQRGYGLIVIIEHTNGLVTVYAHNRDLRVKSGQVVRTSQVVATVGESGRTSGPHLHFEVRKDGTPMDPLRYLGPPPAAE
jgi:murein DD-endopeptidase MepM/ murein hydrolase activator NlpD